MKKWISRFMLLVGFGVSSCHVAHAELVTFDVKMDVSGTISPNEFGIESGFSQVIGQLIFDDSPDGFAILGDSDFDFLFQIGSYMFSSADAANALVAFTLELDKLLITDFGLEAFANDRSLIVDFGPTSNQLVATGTDSAGFAAEVSFRQVTVDEPALWVMWLSISVWMMRRMTLRANKKGVC